MSQDEKSSYKKVPGRWKRTLKTGGLTGALGASFVGGKFTDLFRSKARREEAKSRRNKKNATRILGTMEELRGPIMKIGQLLSTHAEALPPMYSEMLTGLQSQAPPMPYSDVRAILIEEFGAPPEEVFERFEEEAHAAASMGQVHRAWLKTGEAVAVKIQYPGVEQMVEGDLSNLKAGIQFVKVVGADALRQKSLDLMPIYEEIAGQMRQETDACRESFNARMVREIFEGHPDLIVPKVFLDYCGLKVVTYEFIEGKSIKDFIQDDVVTQEEKEHLANLLTDAFWWQLLKGGVLHADPHPGNYFITPDRKLALLDFGCVKIFQPGIVEGMVELSMGYIEDDDERTHAALIQLDMLEDPEDMQEFEDLRRVGAYFCLGLHSDEPFSFEDVNYVGQGRELIEFFLSRRRIPKAQREFIFLTRVVLGYYEYFSRLKLKMNFRRKVMPYLEQGWKGRQISIPNHYLPE